MVSETDYIPPINLEIGQYRMIPNLLKEYLDQIGLVRNDEQLENQIVIK